MKQVEEDDRRKLAIENKRHIQENYPSHQFIKATDLNDAVKVKGSILLPGSSELIPVRGIALREERLDDKSLDPMVLVVTHPVQD